jgi:NAD(P)-dependent dehydrogenase (short-subunit alcohol dehydrogenase family)
VSRLPTRLPVYLVSGWDRRVEAEVCICGDRYRGNAVEHDEAAPGEIKAVGYVCDVSNDARVEEVFASIKGKVGRINCLVTADGSSHQLGFASSSLYLDALAYGTCPVAMVGVQVYLNGGIWCGRRF